MTDQRTTFERISSANPVPSPDSFPSRALSSADLLASIDERTNDMTDTLTPIRATKPGKPPGRGRGPLIALAVAAVLILIIGITTFNVLTGDESTVVTEPPPATTEAPATTTTLAQFESLLPADTPASEVVAALQAAWDTGDMDGADALIRPDSQYFVDNVSTGISAEIWYRVATGMTVERTCSIDASGLQALGAPLQGGDVVQCDETLISGLSPGTVVGGGTFAAEVKDGWVLDFAIFPEYVGALSEPITDYRTWMEERFPEQAQDMFVSSTRLRVNTPEERAQHQDFVPFFAASVGPRAEQALPADTSLIDVVDVFAERFAAGDIEGYEAIFHPIIGYPSGTDADASWFGEVTGGTGERECEVVSFTQIRCTERAISGLEPGTISDPYTTQWNGADGYIWSIEFPDGPPPGFDNSALAPGVADYRDWVKANAPDMFDSLFPDGLAMDLSTEAVRASHRDMVANYLAATG